MLLGIPSTGFDSCTRIPTNAHRANIFDEIAPINGPQIGALGVHFDGLVPIMAPENISSCMTHYLVSLYFGNLWALVELANHIVRRQRNLRSMVFASLLCSM